MRSILTTDENRCYLCGRWIGSGGREIHHIFGASNRPNSEKYGLVVPLCHWCHNEPPHGVHHSKDTDLRLKRMGQKAFIHEYSEGFFREVFGKLW